MFAQTTRFSAFMLLVFNLISAHHVRRISPEPRLARRRMGQENNVPIGNIIGCPGEICGTFGGKSIGTLLAGAPVCAPQNLADEVITVAKTSPLIKDEKVRQEIIEWAKKLCAAEKNTHPIYFPLQQRKRLYCQEIPKNKELLGIVPAQDPANGNVTIFFDPKNPGKSVNLGDIPETKPRQDGIEVSGSTSPGGNEASSTSANSTGAIEKASTSPTPAVANETVITSSNSTVANATESTSSTNPTSLNQNSFNNQSVALVGTPDPVPSKEGLNSTVKPQETKIQAAIDLSKYKTCDKPEIKLAGGLPGRKPNEYLYAPVEASQFKHQGALNLQIVTQAMCDQILACIKREINKDDDEQGAVKNCRALAEKLGVQKAKGDAADQWNASFGLSTSYKDLPIIQAMPS